jgi:hypothetical protein
MPSADHFRRQADQCLKLSLLSSSKEIAKRLVSMALEYRMQAEALERRSGTAPVLVSEIDSAESDGSRQ